MTSHQNSHSLPEPTRKAGDQLLDQFASRMGGKYTSGRNYDCGPGKHKNVSMLSPYIRSRLVCEQDVVTVAMANHGLEGAEKFIQEVVWRGYFKGWLERRPQIWQMYRSSLDGDIASLDTDRRLRKRIEQAEDGRTGLDYFDSWVEELVETGYLHNHARMWFASIWIFTLGLPWRLGADFFMRHLLDGDPASNTLSWRWVGGLHTRGKTYQAQDWNIAKFTQQRFKPNPKDLAEVTGGLEAEEPNGLPEVQPLRQPKQPAMDRPSVLLITQEDCRPEDFALDHYNILSAATLATSHLRSPMDIAEKVKLFEEGALADAAKRSDYTTQPLMAGLPADLAQWVERQGATQIITPYIPEGYVRDWLQSATPALNEAGIVLTEMRREWDTLIWPHATAGFFKVKKQIPKLLDQLEIEAGQTRMPF